LDEAQESLEDVLAMGLTYADLVQQGMHPEFLSHLFAKLQSNPDSRPPSTPPVTRTSLPQSPFPPQNESKPHTPAEVDQFLQTLAPTLPNSRNTFNRKRNAPVGKHVHPPTKKPFGASQSAEIFIDVSSDEEDSSCSESENIPTLHQRRTPRAQKSKVTAF
jgi:hypothetical protein